MASLVRPQSLRCLRWRVLNAGCPSLLEGDGTPPGDIELHIDQTGNHPLIQGATWQPPDLLLKCEHCNGTGEYVGLVTVEKCQRCAGRGFTVGYRRIALPSAR